MWKRHFASTPVATEGESEKEKVRKNMNTENAQFHKFVDRMRMIECVCVLEIGSTQTVDNIVSRYDM